jgi:uncharacterized protein (TIGR02145 family)/uncharacterized repeat protein (TIGR02543 family)
MKLFVRPTKLISTTLWAAAMMCFTLAAGAAAATHTVTIIGNGINAVGEGTYAAGAKVSITAGNHAKGTPFKKWTAKKGDVKFNDEFNAKTTFVMPDKDVVVKAEFGVGLGKKLDEDMVEDNDGQSYDVVQIGDRKWMAENLNYNPVGNGSRCYNNEDKNCDDKYGRLYDWPTAMNACPAHWHLANNDDWDNLKASVNNVASKLKAEKDWNPVGDNESGFSALPGGTYIVGQNLWSPAKMVGYWWSATEAGNGADVYHMSNSYSDVRTGNSVKENLNSVRCVANTIVPNPKLVSSSVTYDGKAHPIEFIDFDVNLSPYTVTGGGWINADKYTVYVSLKDKLAYEWEESGTSADLTFEFKITKKQLETPEPASHGVVFDKDKKEQCLDIEDLENVYEVTGKCASGVNKDGYTAYVTLLDTKNYEWKDNPNEESVPIEWKVIPAKGTFVKYPVSPISVEYKKDLKLSDIKLTDEYEWVDENVLLDAKENQLLQAIYTPTNQNYLPEEGQILVSVSKKQEALDANVREVEVKVFSETTYGTYDLSLIKTSVDDDERAGLTYTVVLDTYRDEEQILEGIPTIADGAKILSFQGKRKRAGEATVKVLIKSKNYDPDIEITVNFKVTNDHVYKIEEDQCKRCTPDKDSYTIGETVTVTAGDSRIGEELTGWKVNGVPVVFSGRTYEFRMPDDDDLTVEAVFTDVPFTITFEPNGGTLDAPSGETLGASAAEKIGRQGGQLPSLPVAKKDGYSYVGWYTTIVKNGVTTEVLVDADYVFTDDATIYVKGWTANTYNVTWKIVGDEPSESKGTFKYDLEPITVPWNPEKTGYTLSSWYSTEAYAEAGKEAGKVEFSPEHPFNEPHDVVFFAKWIQDPCVVTWLANGGEFSERIMNRGCGDNISLDDVPRVVEKKVDHEFAGWYRNAEFQGSQVDFSSEDIVVYNGLTFYAKWVPVYTITFHTDDTKTFTKTTDVNGNVVGWPAEVEDWPAGYNKSNYTFVGWFTSAEEGEPVGNDKTFGENDGKNVYAHWKFTIRYEFVVSGEADVPDAPNSTTIYGLSGRIEPLLIPDPPTSGDYNYEFLGWYKELGGTEQVTDKTLFSGDATIYGYWSTIRKYDVIFHANGGEFGDDADDGTLFTVTKKTDANGMLIGGLPKRPTRDGNYSFDDWYLTQCDETEECPIDSKLDENPRFSHSDNVYAHWTTETKPPVSYTIRFNANRGLDEEIIDELKTNALGILTTWPSDPKWDNHIFVGWSLTPDGIAISKDYGFGGDKDLYAVWRGHCIVKFEAPGAGVSESEVTVLIGQTLKSLPTASRTGIGDPTEAFLGWFTTQTSGGTEITLETKFTADMTVYARWISIFEVTFDPVDGVFPVGTVPTCKIGVDRRIKNFPADPGKPGYTFTGWFTAAENGVEVTDGSNGTQFTQFTSTVYAQYAPAPGVVVITFNYNGATGGNLSLDALTRSDGKLASLPWPIKTGYRFAGWFKTEALLNGDAVKEKETVFLVAQTIYAKWTEIPTVTFNPNGGSFAEETELKDGKFVLEVGEDGKLEIDGLPVDELPVPEIEGEFVFLGWFDAADGGTEVDENTNFIGKPVVYAHWQSTRINITFNLNGGTGTIPSVEISAGGKLTTAQLPTPTSTQLKTGYTFAGWKDGKGAEVVAGVTTFDVATELFAQWTAIEYDITYTLNGGTVTPTGANPAKYTIESTPITLVNPTKLHHNFDGWTEGTNVAKLPTVTIPTGSTGNKTYTANWSPYVITFDVNEGNPLTTTTASVDATTGKLTDAQLLVETPPTRTGYAFVGWFESKTGATDVKVTSAKVFDGNTTLYARWSQIVAKYEIKFKLNGAPGVDPVEKTNDQAKLDALPTDPVWANHGFIGWYTTSTGGDKITLQTQFTKDSEVFAIWAPFTITFDVSSAGTGYTLPDGFTAAGKQTGLDGKLAAANLPATLTGPAKAGYDLEWWTLASGGTQVTAASYVFTANTKIFARWKPSSVDFKITFNADGGTPTVGLKHTLGNGTVDPWPTVTKVGYVFKGWFKMSGSTMTDVEVTEGTVFDSDLTVKAKWAPHVVTYDANGGTTTATTTEVGSGGTLTSAKLNVSATRAGYTFGGWYTEETEGSKVTTTTIFNEDATIYARWTPVNYTITYTLAGGTVSPANANPTSYNVETPDIVLVAPTRAAYVFDGWTGSNGTVKDPDVVIPEGSTGAKSYTANWTAVISEITFNVNGGTELSSPTAKTAAGGKLSSLPTPLARNGYTFGGWFTEQEGGTKVELSTVFSEDATVYARWTPVSYTISYTLGGGTAANPTSYNVETPDIALVAPTRPAYEFAGWTGSNGTTKQLEVVIPAGSSGAKNYTANWTAIIYDIEFDVNGGTKLASETAKTVAGGKLASLPTPTRDKYAFDGWFDEPTGGTKVTTSTVFEDDATIYAQWSLIHTITFNPNGGTVSPATANTGAGGKLPSLPTPTLKEYRFVGWFTEKDGGTAVNSTTVFDDTATVYAHWTKLVSVVLTFSAGANGTLSATVDGLLIASGTAVDIGKDVFFTATPAAGYKVLGWTMNGSPVRDVDSLPVYMLTGMSSATTVTVSFEPGISVATPDREIPSGKPGEVGAIAPVKPLSGLVTVGPNPVKVGGDVAIYWNGAKAVSGKLGVFNAVGQRVAVVDVSGTKKIGEWKTLGVAEGTYLVKGVLTDKSGVKVGVSQLVGVVR